VTHSSYTTLYLEMAAPPSPSAVLRDEIQTAGQHKLQQLIQNEVQQVRADFAAEIQKVQTGLQKLRAEVVPELKRV
jgi:hypothetical protein